MRYLLLLGLVLSGCTVQTQADPKITGLLGQHTAVINGITAYIADLQAKGVLPKPEVKKEK